MNLTEMSLPNKTDPEASSASKEAVTAISILLLVFGLAGNGLIVYGFIRFRGLRTLTNYFVFNLAIADILLIAGLAAWIIQENPNGVLRAIMVNNDVLCFSASMLNMAAVSIDRFYAVTKPLKYEQTITKSRARIATILIWAYSLIMFGIGVSRYFADSSNKIFMTTLASISFVIPALIMIFAHLSILRIAWISKRAMRGRRESSSGRSKEIAKSLKLSFNTLVILVPMVTAWGVFYGITILEAYCSTCKIPTAYSVTVGLLPYVAAAIDPIIYILVTRDLRMRLCRCFRFV